MIKKAKAKTAKGSRVLKAKEPQLVEGAKTALFLKSSTSSVLVASMLEDLYSLKKPDAILFSRKHEAIHPFEAGGAQSMEFFSTKNDAGVVVLGGHSKKRPDNLTWVRTFNHAVLDVVEVGLEGGLPIDSFNKVRVACLLLLLAVLGWCTLLNVHAGGGAHMAHTHTAHTAHTQAKLPAVGNRPLCLFHGEGFETDPELGTLRSILLDTFRGDASADKLDLKGISHVLSFTAHLHDPRSQDAVRPAARKRVMMRVYDVVLMKSGVRAPRVELVETGPRYDWVVGRTRLADPEMMKAALLVPKQVKVGRSLWLLFCVARPC
jgi:ribosome production factor 2